MPEKGDGVEIEKFHKRPFATEFEDVTRLAKMLNRTAVIRISNFHSMCGVIRSAIRLVNSASPLSRQRTRTLTR